MQDNHQNSPWDPRNVQVTLVPNIKVPALVDYVTLQDVWYKIVRDLELKTQTDMVRAETDEDKQEALKEKLPAVIFAGTFNRAANKGFKAHSSMAVVDFDRAHNSVLETEEGINTVVSSLQKCPYTVLVYKSPRNGVKWVARITINPEQAEASHKEVVKQLFRFAEEKWSLTADPNCCALSQKCFLCHDPQAKLQAPTDSFPPPSTLHRGTVAQVSTGAVAQEVPLPFSPSGLMQLAANDPMPESVQAIDVTQFQPARPSQNHDLIFKYARRCRIAAQDTGVELAESHILKLGGKWYDAANQCYLSKSRDEYQGEFYESFMSVRFLSEGESLSRAAKFAASHPHPCEEQIAASHPLAARLLSFIWHLCAEKGFCYLGTRDAGKFLDCSHSTANAAIKVLIGKGWIRLKTPPRQRRQRDAHDFDWIGPEGPRPNEEACNAGTMIGPPNRPTTPPATR